MMRPECYPALAYELEYLWDWCRDHQASLTITTDGGGRIIVRSLDGYDSRVVDYNLAGGPLHSGAIRRAQELCALKWKD